MFYPFPEAGITQFSNFQDINLYRCQEQAAHSLHSQLQKPVNAANYVGIAPSAASGPKDFFLQPEASVSVYCNRICIGKFLSAAFWI